MLLISGAFNFQNDMPQDAEKNLKIAANLDPFKASYVLELAKLYETGGMNLRAQKALEKAQAIDPTVE